MNIIIKCNYTFQYVSLNKYLNIYIHILFNYLRIIRIYIYRYKKIDLKREKGLVD